MLRSAVKILIMSATIAPKAGVPNLVRTDPAIRLQDYMKALNIYVGHLGTTFDFLVFAENSQSDMEPLRAAAAVARVESLVEFLSFDGLDYPAAFDRGYGEFKLLDYVMDHSDLIRSRAAGIQPLVLWKVTGRYIVDNIADVTSGFADGTALYCNYRNYPKRLVDMYLMAWTPSGYERYLRGVFEALKMDAALLAAGRVPEELLRGVLDAAGAKSEIQRRFKTTPRVSGLRGGDNKDYGTDQHWKYRVRKTAQVLVPGVWI